MDEYRIHGLGCTVEVTIDGPICKIWYYFTYEGPKFFAKLYLNTFFFQIRLKYLIMKAIRMCNKEVRRSRKIAERRQEALKVCWKIDKTVRESNVEDEYN